MKFNLDFKDIITYGSFIVSLTVAYYTHEVRIVKLETETQQDRKVVQEIKDELKDMRRKDKSVFLNIFMNIINRVAMMLIIMRLILRIRIQLNSVCLEVH